MVTIYFTIIVDDIIAINTTIIITTIIIIITISIILCDCYIGMLDVVDMEGLLQGDEEHVSGAS